MVSFPEDVIIDILLRLPSKSLVRSRCVSKHWDTLITSPYFIKAHLQRASKLCHLLYQESTCSIRDPEEKTVSKLEMRFSGCTEFSNLDPPPAITDSFSNFRLVDSFNGIACLYAVNERASTSRIWLWNPAINDCFVVPEPQFPISSAKSYCVGFGFSPLTSHLGDFKVVSVTLYYEGDGPDENCISRAEIYSRRTNSWKELVGWFPKWCSSETGNHQVIFEEYICWSPYYRRWDVDRDTKKAIVSFNVVTEEFHEIALPDLIPCYDWAPGCITLLDGCVSLLAPYSRGCEVWTMKEFGNIESWSKLYNIDNVFPRRYGRRSFFGSRCISCRPLGFASTDEAIFLRLFSGGDSSSMLSYDIKTMTGTRTVGMSKTVPYDSSFEDCCLKLYMASLIPVSYMLSL